MRNWSPRWRCFFHKGKPLDKMVRYTFMHYYTFDIHNGFVHYILVCRLFHSLNDLLVCVFYFYYSLQQYNVYYSINRPTDLPSVHLFGRPSGHSSVCPFVVSSCVRSFIGSFFVVRSFVCSSVCSIRSFVVVWRYSYFVSFPFRFTRKFKL